MGSLTHATMLCVLRGGLFYDLEKLEEEKAARNVNDQSHHFILLIS